LGLLFLGSRDKCYKNKPDGFGSIIIKRFVHEIVNEPTIEPTLIAHLVIKTGAIGAWTRFPNFHGDFTLKGLFQEMFFFQETNRGQEFKTLKRLEC
jgi:hypothetical protein